MSGPKELLVKGNGELGARMCNHQGFIVPMAMIPTIQSSKVPGQEKPIQQTIFIVVQAQCVRCGQAFNFNHVPKEDPGAASVSKIDSSQS